MTDGFAETETGARGGMNKQQVSYVVGEERGVLEILRVEDIRPLLAGVTRAGAAEAFLVLEDGMPVCSEFNPAVPAEREEVRSLQLEGEPVGNLIVRGRRDDPALTGMATMLHATMNIVLGNNLKRMLTTEMHTTVVTRSYEELMAKNRDLEASETRYRELAESLEVKVRERTAELEQAHARLLQREKMASIGQLAAGVAHEINNPMGFITSNLTTLKRYIERLETMLTWQRDRLEKAGQPGMQTEAEARWKELKIDFILSDVHDLFRQSLEGAERVKKIVADLKAFSHVDEAQSGPVELPAELDRTLSVLGNHIPAGTEIIKEYRPLPAIAGNGALFCQVFMNLLVNAFHARPEGLVLRLSIGREGEQAVIVVADNGPGVDPAIRGRIFDPFFTTRDVGAGTGMGLTVVHEIVRQHEGTVEVDDAPGGGARFTIRLPIVAVS